jgi:hypothetical protein
VGCARSIDDAGQCYIIPLSIDLQKSRWLIQASGYYLKLATSVDPRGFLYRSGSLAWNSGLVDVALGYRVIETTPSFSLVQQGCSRPQKTTFDNISARKQL